MPGRLTYESLLNALHPRCTLIVESSKVKQVVRRLLAGLSRGAVRLWVGGGEEYVLVWCMGAWRILQSSREMPPPPRSPEELAERLAEGEGGILVLPVYDVDPEAVAELCSAGSMEEGAYNVWSEIVASKTKGTSVMAILNRLSGVLQQARAGGRILAARATIAVENGVARVEADDPRLVEVVRKAARSLPGVSRVA